jgi:hypothetical protein
MRKLYRVFQDGKFVSTSYPGLYAGITTEKIFGRLDCWSGKRYAKAKNRIFFWFWDDAIKAGYRPCKKCKPTKHCRKDCDHMPFGLTGGVALSVTKLRVRFRISCTLCGKVLDYGRRDRRGRVRWNDGFIVPHEVVAKAAGF